MKLKNEKLIQSIAICAGCIAFFIGRSGGYTTQVITEVIGMALCLFNTYITHKGLNNDFLILILPILLILVCVLAFVGIDKYADKQKK